MLYENCMRIYTESESRYYYRNKITLIKYIKASAGKQES